MSTLQLKINSELYNFSMEVDQRRIKAANRSALKNRKSVRKDLLRRIEKKQKSKTHACNGSYMVLG